MQIYWNKRKRFHKKRVQLPKDWFGTTTWRPFHCFGTPIWPPWRHVKTLYTLVTYRVKFLRHWYEIRWYFHFSPLKLSSSNWTVSTAGDVTSSCLAALFALLSMAECFKIYTILTIRLLWCLQPIHFCSTDILKEKCTPASVLSQHINIASRRSHVTLRPSSNVELYMCQT